MLRVTEGRKPIWITLQIAFSGTSCRRTPAAVPDVPAAAIHDVPGDHQRRSRPGVLRRKLASTLSERDRPYGWNWTYWERVLRPVVEEVGDKGPLAEALCAANSKLPVKANGERDRVVRA